MVVNYAGEVQLESVESQSHYLIDFLYLHMLYFEENIHSQVTLIVTLAQPLSPVSMIFKGTANDLMDLRFLYPSQTGHSLP